MRAGGYLRVSRDDQVKGFSLETQRGAIERFAADRGWEVAFYQDAGESAWGDDTTKRPAFDRMMADVRAGVLDCVLVYRVDRFARSIEAATRELRLLYQAGAAFASVTEPGLDYTTAAGRLQLVVFAGMAQHFSDVLSERVSAGIQAAKAATGRNAVGAVPWGAERVDGRLRVDPALAGTLAELLEMAASAGDWTVADRLNRLGVRTLRGHEWTPERVGKAIRSWRWLLDQPDPWPARYLAAVGRPRRPPVGAGKGTNLLTGLARCPCGGWLRYQRSKDRPAVRLVCARPGCPHNRGRLTADVAEGLVAAWFLALRLPAIGDSSELRDTESLSARLAALAEERELLGMRLQARAIGRADFLRAIAAVDAEERLAVASAAGETEPIGAMLGELQADWALGDTPGWVPDIALRNGVLRMYATRVIVGSEVAVEPVPVLARALAVAP